MEILMGTNIDGNIDGKREQNMTLLYYYLLVEGLCLDHVNPPQCLRLRLRIISAI